MRVVFSGANSTIAFLTFLALAGTRFVATGFGLEFDHFGNDASHFALGSLEPLLSDVTRLVPTHFLLLQKINFIHDGPASQC